MEAAYLGAVELMYFDYIDAATGQMLIAKPGGVYDMKIASGREGLQVPPGDGRWENPPVKAAAAEQAPALPVPSGKAAAKPAGKAEEK